MLWVLIRSASQGASNEYPQYRFSWRNKKNINEKIALSGAVGDMIIFLGNRVNSMTWLIELSHRDGRV